MPKASGAAHRRIMVDRALCVGTGNCVFYADRTFDLDDENTAVVVDPNGNAPHDVESAIDACPVRALSFAPDDAGS